MIKFEFRRAFGKEFCIALLLGVLSGVGGFISYYFDFRYAPAEAVSRYDAWLYCNSVAESSFFRLLLPVIVCYPYLLSFYTDRNSTFIYMVETRTKYGKYVGIKLLVGIVSTSILILMISAVWLLSAAFLFPSNPPITELNLHISGAFSQYYKSDPVKYIAILTLLSMGFSAVYYIFCMALSYFAKNRKQAMVYPFLTYVFLIIISQVIDFPYCNPSICYLPYEAPEIAASGIAWSMFSWLMVGLIILFYHFSHESKEILPS